MRTLAEREHREQYINRVRELKAFNDDFSNKSQDDIRNYIDTEFKVGSGALGYGPGAVNQHKAFCFFVLKDNDSDLHTHLLHRFRALDDDIKGSIAKSENENVQKVIAQHIERLGIHHQKMFLGHIDSLLLEGIIVNAKDGDIHDDVIEFLKDERQDDMNNIAVYQMIISGEVDAQDAVAMHIQSLDAQGQITFFEHVDESVRKNIIAEHVYGDVLHDETLMFLEENYPNDTSHAYGGFHVLSDDTVIHRPHVN